MTNTRPVPNTSAKLVDKAGFIVAPWIQFFQQFVQKAPTILDVSSLSPYQANQIGTIIISSTSTGATLTRGTDSINLGNGQKIVPISISDIVSWTGPAVVKFLGS